MESLVHLCMEKLPKKRKVIMLLPAELREFEGYLYWCAKRKIHSLKMIGIFDDDPHPVTTTNDTDDNGLQMEYIQGHKCKCRGPRTSIAMGNVQCIFCRFGFTYIRDTLGNVEYAIDFRKNKAIKVYMNRQFVRSSVSYDLYNMTRSEDSHKPVKLTNSDDIKQIHEIIEKITATGIALRQTYLSSKND
jgi:hypothetical protein